VVVVVWFMGGVVGFVGGGAGWWTGIGVGGETVWRPPSHRN